MPPRNPCPAPNLPPLKLELEDIPVSVTNEQYTNGKKVVEAYWRQACNMTKDEQEQYIDMVKTSKFIVKGAAKRAPSNHEVYKDLDKAPTWSRYVFLLALYKEFKVLQQRLLIYFGSLQVTNLEKKYREHHQLPKKTSRKRKAVAETATDEASSPAVQPTPPTGTPQTGTPQHQMSSPSFTDNPFLSSSPHAPILPTGILANLSPDLMAVVAQTSAAATPTRTSSFAVPPAPAMASSSPHAPRPVSPSANAGAAALQRRLSLENVETRLGAKLAQLTSKVDEVQFELDYCNGVTNDRITLALEAITELRQTLDDFIDVFDTEMDPSVNAIVNRVDRLLNRLAENGIA